MEIETPLRVRGTAIFTVLQAKKSGISNAIIFVGNIFWDVIFCGVPLKKYNNECRFICFEILMSPKNRQGKKTHIHKKQNKKEASCFYLTLEMLFRGSIREGKKVENSEFKIGVPFPIWLKF